MVGKRHLDKNQNLEDIKKLENYASELRNIYIKFIQESIEDIQNIKLGDFKNPNWAYERAYKDGMLFAYNELLKLIGE